MNEQVLVSIIIPTYNSSKFICETMESVLKQSYQNIEVIIIDDESSDETMELLARFSAKDSRVKVFSQSHQGPSRARAKGVREAEGEFLVFIDSDDLMLPLAIEKMTEIVLKDGVDCVISDYLESYEPLISKLTEASTLEVSLRFLNFRTTYLENAMRFHGNGFMTLASATYGMVMWGKMIRKSSIPLQIHEMFPPSTFGEDFLFNHIILSRTSHVSFWQGNSLIKRLHKGSLTGRRRKESIDFIDSANNALQIYKKLDLSKEKELNILLSHWASFHLVYYVRLKDFCYFIHRAKSCGIFESYIILLNQVLGHILRRLSPKKIFGQVLVGLIFKFSYEKRIMILMGISKLTPNSLVSRRSLIRLHTLCGVFK